MFPKRHHAQRMEAISADAQAPAKHTLRKILVRCACGAAVLGILFLLIHYLMHDLPDLKEWVRNLGFWGPVAYCIIFIVLTAIFFPESIIAIAAGALFGFGLGLLWVFVAGTIGAMLIYVIARKLLLARVRNALEHHPKLKAFDEAAGQQGFKLMFLLRLAPVNYSLLCYLLSVSSARFKPYVFACLGMIPGNFSTVYFGYAAQHVSEVATKKVHEPTDWVHEVTIYMGLGLAIITSTVIARVATKAIHKMQKQQEQQDETVVISPGDSPAPPTG